MEEPVAGGAEVRKEMMEAGQVTALPMVAITIVRHSFRLVVKRRQEPESREWVHGYAIRCAIGKLGFETKANTYTVLGKESPPTYTAPDKAWAREAGYEPGEKLPPDDPMNPLRGAFLWLNDHGVGIHGTDNPFSIGSKASHGCVRVTEAQALELFELVPLGTQVTIV